MTMLSENPEYAKTLHPKLIEALEKRGIQDFYPPQWDAIQKGLTGKNLIISIPTASGKTLIAEVLAFNQFFTKHSSSRIKKGQPKKKILYL